MERYKRVFKEEIEGIWYTVIQLGGSIGSKSIRDKKQLKNKKYEGDASKLFSIEQEALNKATRLNKSLSPGEKQFYKIKYVVAEIIDGKYTGN